MLSSDGVPAARPQYLARYLYGVASFWCLLRRERLAPQRARDGTALSMHQWRRLLSTTRLPGQHKDTIRAMFQTGQCGEGGGGAGRDS